jgi:general secretion pathway protein A
MSETYYGRFYGFNSPPFHITPDPSLLFATETHQQALGAIEYGIASGKGFIVITGEVGVGKTTVLKMCLDRLESSRIKIIYLFNPSLATAELYATILEELDVPVHPGRKPTSILHSLQRALLAAHKAGTQVILAVDEAQNMPEQTLESLRILSNFETAKSKLLQIILAGQPELEAILAKYGLRQLAQRVAVRARIKPLTWRQSCRYIEHRGRCAGRIGKGPLFTSAALWYLAITARGIPRTINICCDNALINGYGYAAERISLSIARESCKALKFRSPFRRVAAIAATTVILICAIFSGNAFLRGFLVEPASGTALQSTVGDQQPAVSEVEKGAEAHPPAVVALPSPPAVSLTAATEAVTEPTPEPAETHLALEAYAEGPPKPQSDAVQAATITSPIPTTAASAEPASMSSDAAVAEPSDRDDPQPVRQWFVHRGDTVYKACRAAYGRCDEQALRTILAYNPRIASNGIIKQGMIIIMPERIEPVRSN